MKINAKQRLALPILGVVIASTTAPLGAQTNGGGTPSSGVFKTGQQIFELCAPSDSALINQCDYFIMAAHDMMKYHADLGKITDKLCLPTGTKEAEVRAAVLAYWRKSLANLKYSAVSAIRNALTERWGC